MEKIVNRCLLKVGYDGSAYRGWQFQKNGPSVQDEIQKALFKLTGKDITIYGASRTDAGVHALSQFCHFDNPSEIKSHKFALALNAFLPMDIRIISSQEVDNYFHARYNAIEKTYSYRIWNASYAHPILGHMTAHVPKKLDINVMNQAIPTILGEHDFSAFQASGGISNTTIRTLKDCYLTKDGNLYTLVVVGKSFLYNMVRIISGTLIDIGHYRLLPTAFSTAFSSFDRRDLGSTAPARGLELSQIKYN